MNANEKKTIYSFKLAKTDIARLQRQLDVANATQDRLIDMINTLKGHQLRLSQKIRDVEKKPVKKAVKRKVVKKKPVKKKVTKKKVVKKVVKKTTKRAVTKFVAAKTGKKFHILACPFAKNIKPKYKVRFKSKTKALNEGYKPCNCVK